MLDLTRRCVRAGRRNGSEYTELARTAHLVLWRTEYGSDCGRRSVRLDAQHVQMAGTREDDCTVAP